MYEIENKVFKDPLYGYVRVDNDLISDLIDTKEMQRLRRIKQLSGVSMVFHIAEHTRFSHSLGTYEILRQVYNEVYDINSTFSQYERMVMLCSGLLHDLGHGPYSHAFEHTFGVNHEHQTVAIIMGDTEVNKVLKAYDPSLPSDVASVIEHRGKFPIIESLVSSQLDADRLDYLKRDAYFTGANYGDIDTDKLIRGMMVKNNRIVYKYKSVHTVEDFLMSRYHMYWQVYFHPVAKSYEHMLEMIYKRLKYLMLNNYEFEANVEMIKRVLFDKTDLEAYIELDDYYVNGAIKQFQYSKDEILSDLCKRFINRKLFKYTSMKNKKEILKDYKYDLEYYYIEDDITKSAYDEDDSQILIFTEDSKLMPLLNYSPVVKGFSLGSNKEEKLIFYCD